MRQDNSKELFPVVDETGCVIGRATRGECHGGSMLLHPVVHLHVIDSDGRIFLQHRPAWKDIQPDKWDTAVGGHVDYGETTDEALRREAREELGITGFEPELIGSYVFKSDREREFVTSFRTRISDTSAVVPSDELDGGRWWTREEIEANPGLFTPNFLNEFRKWKIEG